MDSGVEQHYDFSDFFRNLSARVSLGEIKLVKQTGRRNRKHGMRLKLGICIVSIFFLTLPAFSRKTSKGFFPPIEAAEKKGIPGKWKRWQDFVDEYFRYPLPPMGEAPKSYKGAERSLSPERCGSCHPEQHEQWKATLHARAMGPGIYGQLVDMWKTNPANAQSCNECHAPLAEQQKRAKIGAGTTANWRKNPAHDPKLEMHGLACASCHVRNWRVHGPRKKETPEGADDTTSNGPHAGVERTLFFSRSEFCMGCHQHAFPGPNGKSIQNTYSEWKNSLWGKEGVACQSCHMPDRAHLWRGIHDKEMTLGAVQIDVRVGAEASGEIVTAEVELTNSGAGHYFPTYITPSVDVITELEDKYGRTIPGSRQINVIERKLSSDFSREIHDTRIPPQKSITFRYRRGRREDAARLRVRVHVRPDAFYHHFFVEFLKNPAISNLSRELITQARDMAASSNFDIYDERFELKN